MISFKKIRICLIHSLFHSNIFESEPYSMAFLVVVGMANIKYWGGIQWRADLPAQI